MFAQKKKKFALAHLLKIGRVLISCQAIKIKIAANNNKEDCTNYGRFRHSIIGCINFNMDGLFIIRKIYKI